MAVVGRVEEARLGERPGLDGFRLTSPSGRIVADVAPAEGGAVTSLRVGERELLYRANAFAPPPPGEWSGRAPLLWPAVGRNFTTEQLERDEPQCGFDLDGTFYPLPIHGFARDHAWTPLATHADETGAEVTLALADDESTRAVYPWPFRLQVRHRVDDAGLASTVEVSSPEAIRFGIGNHLTVNLPQPPAYNAVVLASNVTLRHELNSRSLLSGETTPVDIGAGALLADDALLNAVLGGMEGEPWMTVTWPDGLRIRVTQPIGRGAEHVDPADRLFVLYGNRDHAYFCPEPWVGRPNGIQDPAGAVALPAGETFAWTMRIDIEE